MRTDTREFLAEGPQAVREALNARGMTIEVYATARADLEHPDLAAAAERTDVVWRVVDDEVVATICDTVHPQGVVARCRFLDRPLGTVLQASPRLIVVCVDVRDPGNAGAVIRCADAAGADGVILCGRSVDPYNPKAVRASAGSIFHVPLAIETDAVSALTQVRTAGLTVLAAEGTAELDLVVAAERGILSAPTAWLLGNEAWGLPAAVRDLADESVAVPIFGAAESLNLATAAAVCLYASAVAQRR